MIILQLTQDDAQLLTQQLDAQINRLQVELVHTDDRALHRALADDLGRLEALRQRLTRAAA